MSDFHFDLSSAALREMRHDGFDPDFPPGTGEQIAALRSRTAPPPAAGVWTTTVPLVRNWANLDGVNRSCYQTGETEKNLKMLAIGGQDSEVGNPERATENKMSRNMAGFSLIYVGAQITKNARKLLKVSNSASRIRT